MLRVQVEHLGWEWGQSGHLAMAGDWKPKSKL